jgi:Putative Flp pilus-assembly TadE/G-like/von Willebrand factor type A domain
MRSLLLKLSRDESGNTLVMFALMLVGLMLAIGGAVDVGRWLYARDDTLAAVDAAVLAGAKTLQTTKDEAAAVATAQKFYNLNVATRLPVTNDSIAFAVVDGGSAVVATGSADISTVFLQFADISSLPLVPASAAQIAKAEFALGSNGVWSGGNSGDESNQSDEPESREISVMLDVTGSMAGDKLDDLKAAAEDLVNVVLWEGQVENPTKIALVPFSEDIRLPTSTARDAARGTGLPSSKTLSSGSGGKSKTYYLSDCVVERTGTQAYTDVVPDPSQYVMAHYTSSTTGSGSSKTGTCTIPAGAKITPLTSDKTTLISEIEGLSASGGTAGHLGTAWAWYTLSPYWSKLWSTDSAPQAYGTKNLSKIAILMTDGEYNTEYDGNGVKVGSTAAGKAANDTSTKQARALCAAMKQNDDITVYAVGFDLSGETSESYKTLYECASEPKKDYFYNAKDGTQLKNAFRDIAISISMPLYLSR